jgi:hypothetical protein
MCGEKQHNILSSVVRVLLEGGFNVLCEGLGNVQSVSCARTERTEGLAHFDETRVREPPIDDAPSHTLTKFPCFSSSIHLVQTASGSTAAVLRVLRECYGSLHPVVFDLLGGIFHQRFRITKSDIRFVRRSAWMQLVEQSTDASALGLRPTQNRGPPSYLGVLVHNFRCTAFGN